jgi:hypothetical protein
VARFGESSDVVMCSFCSKTPQQVAKIIAGPACYICNECVDLCNEIITEEGIGVVAPPTTTGDRIQEEPPNDLPRYRLLTGPDDVTFCHRVSEALDVGYVLAGNPSLAFDGHRMIAAQAVIWPRR